MTYQLWQLKLSEHQAALWHERQFLPSWDDLGWDQRSARDRCCGSFQAQQVDVIWSKLQRELWPETLDSALQQTSDKIVRVYE